MNQPRRLLLPSLAERLASGRPVITREQAVSLSQQILKMLSAEQAVVRIVHTVKSVTHLASNCVQHTNDGDLLQISLYTEFGDDKGTIWIETNQLDTAALQALVRRTETLSKEMIGPDEPLHVKEWEEQDSYPPVTLWHETTVEALRSARETIIPQLVEPVARRGFRASGFIGVLAKAEAVLTDRGITAYSEETDTEVTVTARPGDGKTTGWSGQAARDWTAIDPTMVATEAAEMCHRNLNPQALEPGRRTAILGSAAVIQLMRFFALHFDGRKSDEGKTGFSKVPDQRKGSRWNEHLFDARIKITTDPCDAEGGFQPWFGPGLVSHPTTWVDEGVLKSLAYGTDSLKHRKPYTEMPYGFRLQGGATSLEQMIAQCEEGIYVNRFASVDTIDWYTGMMTGVTRDGCFLVRKGKIERPVKNFRFLASPFFILNSIIAIGPTHRAVYGYAPWTEEEKYHAEPDTSLDWPRRPMVVPPLMVKDFNFSTLVDAI